MHRPDIDACLSSEITPGGIEITRFGTVSTSGAGRFQDFRGWIGHAVGAPTELASPPAVNDRFRASAQTHRAGGVLLTRLTSGPAVGRWQHEEVAGAVGDMVTLAAYHGAAPVHGQWRGQERHLNPLGMAVLRRSQWSGRFPRADGHAAGADQRQPRPAAGAGARSGRDRGHPDPARPSR